MGKSDMLAIRSPQLLALFVVTLGCSAFSVVQEAAWMEETGGNACGLKENSCPGSAFSGTHAACSIALEFKESCDVVQAEMKARIAATNGWIDRKSHPGVSMSFVFREMPCRTSFVADLQTARGCNDM